MSERGRIVAAATAALMATIEAFFNGLTWLFGFGYETVWAPTFALVGVEIGSVVYRVLLVLVALVLVYIIMIGETGLRHTIQETDDDPSAVGQFITSGLQVLVLLIVLYLLFTSEYAQEYGIVTMIFVAIPVVVVAWVAYLWFQNQRQYARTETTVRQTRRDIDRSFQRWGQIVIGVGLFFIAIIFGFLSGAMTAIAEIGEVIMPYAPELTYLITVAIGYVQMGGAMVGDWLIPELSALQFAGLALILGGIAIMVRGN